MDVLERREKMKLSNQALGALMMALQKCLMEETDIVPLLQATEWELDSDGNLFVTNPPVVGFEDTEVDNVTDFVNEVLTEEN
jgi:hypothetical protein